MCVFPDLLMNKKKKKKGYYKELDDPWVMF